MPFQFNIKRFQPKFFSFGRGKELAVEAYSMKKIFYFFGGKNKN